MLNQIKIENFRGIKSCEISNMGKINVFIGRNNSGKSCILDALCLAKCAINPKQFNESLPRLLLRRRGTERQVYVIRNFWHNYDTGLNISFYLESKEGEKLHIETIWQGDNRLDLLLRDPSGVIPPTGGRTFFQRLSLELDGIYVGSEGESRVFNEKHPRFRDYLSKLTLVDDYLARNLERLETNVFGSILEPRLDKTLAEELNKIYETNAEGFSYIPISPTASGVYRFAITKAERSLHLDELGDGTKYATVILSLCLLLQDSALLIEEIESHQHAGALRDFLLSLTRIAQKKNVQLLITTHNLAIIQTLSQLPEEYGVRFFHLEMLHDGKVVARQFRSVDAKLLSDLGMDLTNLDSYRKFVVVEGDEDLIFVKSLSQRYDKVLDESTYLVKAGNKDLVKHVAAALASTGKQVVTALDYDKQSKEDLVNGISNVLRSKNYTISVQKDNMVELEGGSRIIVIPMGLPSDETLKRDTGIQQHEMEDYCLKLIEIDEELRKWANMSLRELADHAMKAKIEKSIRSKTLLQLLAFKKDMEYGDAISYIVKNADKDNLEKTIKDIMLSIDC